MLRCNIHSNQLPRRSGGYVVTSTLAWGESSAGSSTRWIAWSAERWWPRWSQQRWEDEEWSWSTRIWWWGACQVDRPEWWVDRWWRRASQCGWPCELSCSTTRCQRGWSSPRMDVLSNLGQLDKLWMMSHRCQCPVHLCKRNPRLQCLVLQVMFSWMILSDTTSWLCWEPKRSSSISSKWSFKWGSFEEAACRRSKETAHQQTENGIWREIERCEDCLHRIFHNGWLYSWLGYRRCDGWQWWLGWRRCSDFVRHSWWTLVWCSNWSTRAWAAWQVDRWSCRPSWNPASLQHAGFGA